MNNLFNGKGFFITGQKNSIPGSNLKAHYRTLLEFEGISEYVTTNEIFSKLESTHGITATDILETTVSELQRCNYVIANLSPYRGPQCDASSTWLCGYAIALGIPVFAYTTSKDSIPTSIMDYIDLVYNTQMLESFIPVLRNLHLPKRDRSIPGFLKSVVLNLNPKADTILDVDANTTFILGYRFGKSLPNMATLSDIRAISEKLDLSDNSVFDSYPCHPLIWASCEISKTDED